MSNAIIERPSPATKSACRKARKIHWSPLFKSARTIGRRCVVCGVVFSTSQEMEKHRFAAHKLDTIQEIKIEQAPERVADL